MEVRRRLEDRMVQFFQVWEEGLRRNWQDIELPYLQKFCRYMELKRAHRQAQFQQAPRLLRGSGCSLHTRNLATSDVLCLMLRSFRAAHPEFQDYFTGVHREYNHLIRITHVRPID